jgi:hypothetical protein
MKRTFTYLAAAGALALAACFPVVASAGHGHGHHGGHHGYHGGHHGGDWNGHWNYGYRHGHWHRGRYWGYGVGPCWAWTPYGYEWICY